MCALREKNVYSYLLRVTFEEADKHIDKDAVIDINILTDKQAVMH